MNRREIMEECRDLERKILGSDASPKIKRRIREAMARAEANNARVEQFNKKVEAKASNFDLDLQGVEVGHEIWKRYYKCGKPDPDRAVFTFSVNTMEEEREDEQGVSIANAIHPIALAKWVDGACRTLECDAKYAAAMAATNISSNSHEDIHVPWPAFVVKIPSGVLERNGVVYERILVSTANALPIADSGPEDGFLVAQSGALRTDCAAMFVMPKVMTDKTHDIHAWSPLGISDLLFEHHENDEMDTQYEIELDDGDKRLLRSAKRIVVGLLYTMQHTAFFKGSPRSKFSISDNPRFGPPKHRVMVVGRPIDIDVRESVREWIRDGKKSCSPSVQTLVRGHYKRQVVGIARMGRQVIWVEPYWRGHEEAPIMVRSYKVGGTAA